MQAIESIDRTGIYAIKNRATNSIYIGSTAKSFANRFGVHQRHLSLGYHKNKHLQRAWNKYGEESFEFCIVEVVHDKQKIVEREQCWIDKHFDNCKTCYNVSPIAGSQLGYRFSDSVRKKKSKQTKALWDNPETRARLLASIREAQLRPGHGAKISAGHLKSPSAVRSERSRSGGYAVWAKHGELLKSINAKTYRGFVSPSGERFENIHNLTAFARLHGLTPQGLNCAARGKTTHHKGWRPICAAQFST